MLFESVSYTHLDVYKRQVTALTDDAAIRAAARQLKQQGADYALVTLKDAACLLYTSMCIRDSGRAAHQ